MVSVRSVAKFSPPDSKQFCLPLYRDTYPLEGRVLGDFCQLWFDSSKMFYR